MYLNLNDSISIFYVLHPPSLLRPFPRPQYRGRPARRGTCHERELRGEGKFGASQGRRWSALGWLVAERCRETRKRSLHGSRISDPVKDRRQRQAGGTTAWSWRWPSQDVSQRPRGSDRTTGVTVTVAVTASRKKLPLELRRIGWRSPKAGHEIEVP